VNALVLIDGLTPGLSATGKPRNLKNTACAYAASRISSTLKGSTKQFGWLQASATEVEADSRVFKFLKIFSLDESDESSPAFVFQRGHRDRPIPAR
jgi:hypothetical protein